MSLLDWSEGTAFAHNLFADKIVNQPELGRSTPFHPPHSTAIAGLAPIQGGDDRFHNNVFIGNGTDGGDPAKAPTDRSPSRAGFGLWVYDECHAPPQTGGNVFLHGARPFAKEAAPATAPNLDPQWKIAQQPGRVTLEFDAGDAWMNPKAAPVNTSMLGKAAIPNLPFENPDGAPIVIDTDYFGGKRDGANPVPGPFASAGTGKQSIQVWPRP